MFSLLMHVIMKINVFVCCMILIFFPILYKNIAKLSNYNGNKYIIYYEISSQQTKEILATPEHWPRRIKNDSTVLLKLIQCMSPIFLAP